MRPVMLMTTIENWIKESGLEVTDKIIGRLKSELIAVHPEYYHHMKIVKLMNRYGGVDYQLIIRHSKVSQYYVTTNCRQVKSIINLLSYEYPQVPRSIRRLLRYSGKLGGK